MVLEFRSEDGPGRPFRPCRPPTFKKGESYAGMPSHGPLPKPSAPLTPSELPHGGPSVPPAGKAFTRAPGATTSVAMGAYGKPVDTGNHFTLVNGMPLERSHGGRATVSGAESTASHFKKGAMLLQTQAEKGFLFAGVDAADHFKPGPALLLYTDEGVHNAISKKVEGAARRHAMRHAGADGADHFKHGPALLLRTDEALVVETAQDADGGHTVAPKGPRHASGRRHFSSTAQPAIKDHLRPGPAGEVRTTVGVGRLPQSAAPPVPHPLTGKVPVSPGKSHFKRGGGTMLETGAGLDLTWKVR